MAMKKVVARGLLNQAARAEHYAYTVMETPAPLGAHAAWKRFASLCLEHGKICRAMARRIAIEQILNRGE
jgi:hypothetical protein